MKYQTTNSYSFNKSAVWNRLDGIERVERLNPWRSYSHSEIKSQREDFNDMFKAEAEFRKDDISLVFVLTYNDEHLCYKYGQNLLDSEHLKRFSKSSKFAKALKRWFNISFDFVCVGEYGNGGESHDFIGSRGKGQNPHYHCIGWFHQEPFQVVQTECKESFCGQTYVSIEPYLSCSDVPEVSLSEFLYSLVRFEWQGCYEDDKYIYGRSRYLRSKGLGYVKLDGPIRYASRGGSYIGKYIGKDVKKVYCSAYVHGYAKYVYEVLLNELYESLGSQWRQGEYAVHDLLVSWIDYRLLRKDVFLRDLNLLRQYVGDMYKSDCRLWQTAAFCDLDDRLCRIYTIFDEEFYMDMNGRHSPKVRKFHGFGYSLLGNADLEKGVYYITRKGEQIERFLPPSLSRHVYYDYFVSMAEPRLKDIELLNKQSVLYNEHLKKDLPFYLHYDAFKKPRKVVRYVLNSLGRKVLESKLRRSINESLTLIKSCGSKLLKDKPLEVCIFTHCIRDFNVVSYKFSWLHWLYMLSDFDRAVRYAVQCRQSCVYLEAFPESRVMVDVCEVFRQQMPDLVRASDELVMLLDRFKEAKNNKDKEFNESWFKCYKSNY